MKCERCSQFTPFDSTIVLCGIYHATLCGSCWNLFELWVRTQDFWRESLRLAAEEREIVLDAYTGFFSQFPDILNNLQQVDANRLAAYPIIHAWMRGKEK